MKKKHLRILSYNIHKGFSVGNRHFVLTKIRDAIRAVHADLVFLQEVLGEHELHRRSIKEWPVSSQFEFLADEIWPHYAYGKNAVYTAGHHGNAILSKYPIIFSENIDVSTTLYERRGLLHAKIELPDHAHHVHAICVHLGLREADRGFQVKRIGERIESHVPHGHPLVVAGDFNDWRGKASRVMENELETHEAFQVLKGQSARTFPSWLPVMRLDRIYFRGLEAKDCEALTGEPWKALSDHAALYVELALPLGARGTRN